MKRQKKTCLWECLLLLLLAAVFAAGTAGERAQQSLSGQIIRLHVSAASDSEADQTEKLRVRDAVLAEASSLLETAGSRDEAASILCASTERLEKAGAAVLRDPGTMIRAEVRRELFGTRYYDSFALPGGYYDTLRITIGAGEGRNWWCVVYPQICAAASAEQRDAVAVMGGLTPDQIRLIAQEEPEYRFRFRSIELLEDILGWFRSGEAGIPDSR